MRKSLLSEDYVAPEDLPYGPGNPDYEYDGFVQDELEDERERGKTMNFFEEATAIVRAHAEAVREGVVIGERDANEKLRAIFAAYDQAMERPDTKIPTPLHAAIEMARRKP